ncbi:MAG: hypothetical protein MUO85_07665, partial [candidate division Zixibacteria bacterium]|nr:hypothetical protein [candidate division Zixibacteria bacterium]
MDLTQLKIVPLKSLIPHELADFKRIEFLSKRIVRDGHLRNPIVAGRLEEGNRFLILDGTTRASALKILNFPDVLVQVVDFESSEVKLDTWKHLILGTNRDEIEEEARRLHLDATPTNKEEALSALRDKKVVSCFLFDEENNLVISNGGSDLETQVRELKKLLSVCYRKPRIYCAEDGECFNLAKQAHDGGTVTHLLPVFSKEEIKSMALRGILLPMGITRFIIPQRILRVDISNEVLASSVSLGEKNLFLSELIRYRLENKKI